MISVPFLVCVIGALVWLVFSKWQKIADPWMAELGRLTFFAGLLVTLFSVQGKTVL
jgi:hypothetical protein